MAAAVAQSTVSLPKYGGSSTDNWTDFEFLFRSIVEVTGIADAQRVGFLKLHLRLSITIFPHTKPKHQSRLRINNNSVEKSFLQSKLERNTSYQNMKFNLKTESPEEFLVKLQNLALKACPTPADPPVVTSRCSCTN